MICRGPWDDAEHAREGFLKGARLWVQFKHPNISPFYGLVFEEEFPGLVMPYYENGDLVQYLRNHPNADKLHLMCRASAGIEYLHDLKPNPIVHGDIKASNIMITDDGDVCLVDFGVVQLLRPLESPTISPGTRCRWMSPEIIFGEPSPALPSTSSDIWAFGMTILQIYSKSIPFENIRNDTAVIYALSKGNLPARPEGIDDALWALLNDCWAVDSTRRPAISTISILLNTMASQRLTPKDVNHRVDISKAEHRIGRDDGMPSRVTNQPTAVTPVAKSLQNFGQNETTSHDSPSLLLEKTAAEHFIPMVLWDSDT
ncbi:hypothetical protein NP233_g1203 [Leucocoprinus birnbaumii]|uniref:Protein kinase domain-containing protein n=1 Tax=Leucocoprinus birnbaumii TaxID=56174 RepID=A0AAD5W0G7_9AGAR|nr:hypothetical protein NP233_g1203 [Leucocoprinus birnbaumii]